MERKVYFDNSKGDRLCGIINNVASNEIGPIVILVHGFNSNKNSKTYTVLSRMLGKHNISTLRFDIFGHGESEGRFEDITTSEAVDDILQTFNHLKKKGYKKIGLMGSSFGGIASIMAASKLKDLYVLALRSPVSNYLEKEIVTKSKKELSDWKKKGYKMIEDEGDVLKVNYSFYKDFKNNDGYKTAPKIKAPTLIVHGDKDEAVPYEQSVRTSKLIPSCILVTIKDADHAYSKPEDRQKMLQKIVDFIVEKS